MTDAAWPPSLKRCRGEAILPKGDGVVREGLGAASGRGDESGDVGVIPPNRGLRRWRCRPTARRRASSSAGRRVAASDRRNESAHCTRRQRHRQRGRRRAALFWEDLSRRRSHSSAAQGPLKRQVALWDRERPVGAVKERRYASVPLGTANERSVGAPARRGDHVLARRNVPSDDAPASSLHGLACHTPSAVSLDDCSGGNPVGGPSSPHLGAPDGLNPPATSECYRMLVLRHSQWIRKGGRHATIDRKALGSLPPVLSETRGNEHVEGRTVTVARRSSVGRERQMRAWACGRRRLSTPTMRRSAPSLR